MIRVIKKHGKIGGWKSEKPEGMNLVQRPLYGGAITCNLPDSYIDVSQMREIPDQQEVWVSSGTDTTDSSIIFEIFERS